MIAQVEGPGGQVLLFQDVEEGQCRRAGQWVTEERTGMQRLAPRLGPGIHDLAGSETSAQREPPTERLADAHEIGKNTVAFVLEDDPSATQPREDLIEDEE